MASLEIQLQGFERLQKAFIQAPALVAREMLAWMETASGHLIDEITAITPKDTGLLQKSFTANIESAGTLGVSAVIGTPLNYALPVEFGSKPHDILPKNGNALHFMIRGVPVFAKKVHHPGTKGYFMVTRAFEENKTQIQDSFNRMVERVIVAVARGAV